MAVKVSFNALQSWPRVDIGGLKDKTELEWVPGEHSFVSKSESSVSVSKIESWNQSTVSESESDSGNKSCSFCLCKKKLLK